MGMGNYQAMWKQSGFINGGELCQNVGVAYIRKFKTASGATGVQVCYKEHSKIVKTVHVGSANSPEGLNRLLIKAQEIIDEGKSSLFDLSGF